MTGRSGRSGTFTRSIRSRSRLRRVRIAILPPCPASHRRKKVVSKEGAPSRTSTEGGTDASTATNRVSGGTEAAARMYRAYPAAAGTTSAWKRPESD